jgi:signal transduction histidine kinase
MQAIGTLTGGIAHDFNNILWMIVGNSEMLLSELAENANCFEIAKDINIAAQRGKKLVQQLLDFSRKSESEKANFSPAPLLKETLKLLSTTIPSRIDIKNNNLSLPVQIYGDPNKFQQVIMNLCTNAYHAIEDKGSITVTVDEITISDEDIKKDFFKKPGHFLLLQVSDTGCGMAPETIERIYEPFYTTKEVGKGTGLGLSTVLGIVEEMAGFITVDSKLGIGSCFKVYLLIHNTNEQSFQLFEAAKNISYEKIAS